MTINYHAVHYGLIECSLLSRPPLLPLYAFQAIDRPLTSEEQRAVINLSSRLDPHPRRAVLVYHYTGLPADAKDLLAKYYDAMFYIANWGTTRLMFRFPNSLINVKQIEPYCVVSYVTCETIGDYVVLDMLGEVYATACRLVNVAEKEKLETESSVYTSLLNAIGKFLG